MFRRFSIFLLIFFLGGCATVYNPATGRKEIILIDDNTEINLGRNAAKELAQQEKILDDKVAQGRLNRVAAKVSSASDRPLKYEFHILDNKELNAVSLPGGIIYVNKGLFDRLNDDQLAFVLGHEVGHVAAKHAVKKIQANMAFQLILLAASSAVGDNQSGAAQALNASSQVYNLVSLGYSREDEYFADSLGVKYSKKAGYDPLAAISALEMLKVSEGSNSVKVPVYLRTHPYVDDRINRLKEIIPQMKGVTNGRAN